MNDLAFLTFDQLLESYFDRPGVDAELERRYGGDAAVLVADFTDMVERTDIHGVGYALAMASAAQRVLAPVFSEHGGVRVKQVADTVFVVFATAGEALLAALDGMRALDAFNRTRTGMLHHGERNEPIHGCMGLGFGRALVIPGRDLFGAEVNRAFVLGEDVARAGEVLMTEAFRRALGGLPDGVGAFTAPGEREEEAGFGFHVLADYRPS